MMDFIRTLAALERQLQSPLLTALTWTVVTVAQYAVAAYAWILFTFKWDDEARAQWLQHRSEMEA